MKLYLIRHGHTVMNEKGVLNGHTEDPLTEAGKLQIDLLGKKMQTVPLDMLWSSDMGRAIQTAEAINTYQKQPLEIKQDIRLRERKMGKYEGMLASDLRKIAAEHGMKPGDYYNIDSELEPDNAILERFKEWFENEILPTGFQNVCIAGHGAFIRAIVSEILDLPGALFLDKCAPLINASITIVEYNPEKQRRRVETLNDYSHVAHTF